MNWRNNKKIVTTNRIQIQLCRLNIQPLDWNIQLTNSHDDWKQSEYPHWATLWYCQTWFSSRGFGDVTARDANVAAILRKYCQQHNCQDADWPISSSIMIGSICKKKKKIWIVQFSSTTLWQQINGLPIIALSKCYIQMDVWTEGDTDSN